MNFLTNNSTDPHFNMAFDEYCLQELVHQEPVFYLWQNRPSVIIGLNQNAYSEVNLEYLRQQDITLARRVTGGGAVFHDLQNLNYTIVGCSEDLEKDYPGYMQFVVDALRKMGIPAELTGRNDILVDGAKVSGYAKRVYRDRLMVHGTLMYDVDIDRLTKALTVPGSKMEASGIASVRSRVANLKDYFPGGVLKLKQTLHNILADGGCELTLPAGALESISLLASEKFSTWEWNCGKSPKAAFSSRRKFACGTVEALFSVDHGVITSFAFGGDFLGNLSSDTISSSLLGCRYVREDILKALSAQPVGLCFDSLTPEELADLIVG